MNFSNAQPKWTVAKPMDLEKLFNFEAHKLYINNLYIYIDGLDGGFNRMFIFVFED